MADHLADHSENRANRANRETIDYYNRHAAILGSILKRLAEDEALDAELRRNPIRQTRARNIAEDGPDAPGLEAYCRNLPRTGQDFGAAVPQ